MHKVVVILELPKRKKIRLEYYDYSSYGAYFVTICIANRDTVLWNISPDGGYYPPENRPNELTLSKYGKIVRTAIEQISCHYENVVVDKYCIMPDHIHLIVFLTPEENGVDNKADNRGENGRMVSAPTVSVIVGSMKRWVSKQIGFSIWEKSFYDRIIRNENEYEKIWQYIDENPLRLSVGADIIRPT